MSWRHVKVCFGKTVIETKSENGMADLESLSSILAKILIKE